jgi:hypothetical protein
MRRALFLFLLVASLPVSALAPNDEMPAIKDNDMPAVKTDVPPQPRPKPATPAATPSPTSPAAPAATGEPAPVQATSGTQIIGEQESPIGLYIMPWRQSAAEQGLDKPARLLEDQLRPLDPDVFRRQVEYHRALSAHLQEAGKITPDSK